MKKEFIKKVKRELTVSYKVKQEIVRDLEEIFASALEHGENEAQVIERLGTPKDFAESMEEQFGFDRIKYKRKIKLIQIICTFTAALTLFLVYVIAKTFQIPQNAIGQADSMTGIKVEAPFAFNLISFIGILGIAALIVALILTTKYIHTKNRENRKER